MAPTHLASPLDARDRHPMPMASNPAGERGPHDSAVAWGAILAGAAAAAALSLILLMLGTGLGLSSVSPWSREGLSATSFGVSAILWLSVTQILASAMGGYLAGRLRSRWSGTHTDEVYFRDTAHGFLAWAVASLTTAALLASATGAIVGGGVQAGAALGGGAATTAAQAVSSAGGAALSEAADDDHGYVVDALFRKDANAVPGSASASLQGDMPTAAAAASQVTRIVVNALRIGALPPDDLRHAGVLVAQQTSLSAQAAEQRVNEAFVRVQTELRDAKQAATEAADSARKVSAYAALWLFIALLSGAFAASLAATFGGRQRNL